MGRVKTERGCEGNALTRFTDDSDLSDNSDNGV